MASMTHDPTEPWLRSTAAMEAHPGLEHPALLYDGTDGFLASMVPYVTDGLEADDVVFVTARSDNLRALRAEVGPEADRARWADTQEWHPHTGTRLRAFHDLVTGELAAGATGIRLAGEAVWPDGPPELVREWQRYESVLNHVLGPFPVTLVCLYDAKSLDPAILDVARVTHPAVRNGGGDRASPGFERPEEFLGRWNADLDPPPSWAIRMPDFVDFAEARRFVFDQAVRAGLPTERAREVCLAANEAITNAFVHGGGLVGVWTWVDAERFICQVQDHGPGVSDPLAGYRPPTERSQSGRGLWISRQIVDLVQVVPGVGGTTVRLHVRPR
jgi:anti-sigma regulatory factor (Ser/Thr protein kinase)